MEESIKKEMLEFRKYGTSVSADSLAYAIYLREDILATQALLDLIHKGEVEVQGEGEDAILKLSD